MITLSQVTTFRWVQIRQNPQYFEGCQYPWRGQGEVDGGKAATGILADRASCNGLCRYTSMGSLDTVADCKTNQSVIK